MGKQSGREIRPYQTETGDELLMLQKGFKTTDEVFHFEHAQNRLQTWVNRLMGWFATFLGFVCLSSMLDLIVDIDPRIRRPLELWFTSLPFSFSVIGSISAIGKLIMRRLQFE